MAQRGREPMVSDEVIARSLGNEEESYQHFVQEKKKAEDEDDARRASDAAKISKKKFDKRVAKEDAASQSARKAEIKRAAGKASGLQTNTLSDTQSDVKVGKLGMVVNWMLVAELGGMEKPNDDANKASQRREGWRQLTEKRVDQDKPLVIDATMRSKMSAFKEAWAKDALVNPMAEQTPQEAWANEASAQARWAKAHGKAAVLANGYWSIAELRCDEKKKRVMAKADKNTDPYKSYNDDQVDEPSSPP